MNTTQNKNIVIPDSQFFWKYIDFHKLLYFIIEKKLFFTRLDKLEDPLEGLPDRVLSILSILEQYPENEEIFEKTLPELDLEIRKAILNKNKDDLKKAQEIIDNYQKNQYANCWFVSEKESIAMWKLYSNNDSFAIRYKSSDLIENVISSAKNFSHDDFMELTYGFVDYKNIWPFNHYGNNTTLKEYPAFKKDKSYIHENEFRFVVATPEDCKGNYENFELPLSDYLNDDFLIYANPYMDNWKIKNFEKLLKQYKLDNKLRKSRLKIYN